MATNSFDQHSKAERSENYDEWAFAAENLLILEGVADCIKQERSAATAVAEDAKAKDDSSEAGNAFFSRGYRQHRNVGNKGKE
ncbi:hypothetical protein EVAR_53666_1 [Eumeta japonica]|uniref:Uncharacterized protein n=1 Tax=Eumeta variegata TaxID=151549 RepID=A0A4C2A3Y1_EUMVA|nr:hypothetical protein EVAR_53666_1 [Eumeta japonica]